MKATGIVRRVDDLGRVVIPKEIRRTFNINEGDPLEIFTTGDGEVIFKKYDDPYTPKVWADETIRKLGDHIKCIHIADKTTTVYTDMGNLTSTCYGNDTYDFSIGVAIALSKGFGCDVPESLRSSSR